MILGGFHKFPQAIFDALQLQAASLSMTGIWNRETLFYYTEKTTRNIQIVVAPISRTPVIGTRRAKAYDYRIGVFVIRQLKAITDADKRAKEDELMFLVDELQIMLEQIERVTVDGRNFDCSIPADEQVPIAAEEYRKSKTFAGVAEVMVHDR